MILIHNVLLNGVEAGYLTVDAGRIGTVGRGIAPAELFETAVEVIDGEGNILLPGAIDCHVHMRDPGLTRKADMNTETRAALAGGVTSVIDMPNTVPQTVTVEAWKDKMALAAEKCHVNYAFFIGATNDNLAELLRADYSRIPGVKLFIGSSTGNMLVDDDDALDRLFAQVRVPICVHAEDEATIARCRDEVKARFDGAPVPVEYHSVIRPAEACARATARAIALAEKYGSRLHIAHVTTAAEVALIRQAKARGLAHVTCEVSPHHLLLCDADYAALGALMKMNPAVKTAADREALRAALLDGTIDMVATDHAPHLLAEKEGDALHAVSGAPIIQWAYPVLMDIFGPGLAARFYAANPARVFGIRDRGELKPGFYADLVLVKAEPCKVENKDVVSKCGWTYLDGRTLRHRIVKTRVSGPQALAFDNPG